MGFRHAPVPSRLLLAAAFTLMTLGVVPVLTQPAEGAVQAIYYASPSGSGSACSEVQPCTLTTAQGQVRTLTTSSLSGDVVVNLQGGTYQLASELHFTSADSGNNGHQVVYQAVPGQQVVFSGGQPVTGWALHDSDLNIYRAALPVGFDSRQLYVDGNRASVASQTPSEAFGWLTQTSTGYTFTSSGPDSWSQTDRVDFVYGPGRGDGTGAQSAGWRYSICPAAAIASGSVTMTSPCWDNGTRFLDSPDPHYMFAPRLRFPTLVENNLALLTSPGQFYLDPSAGWIYYIPRPGEDLATATIVAAGLQSLLTVDDASNLRFSGITFTYATWLFGDEGVLDAQANVLFSHVGDVLATPADPHEVRMMPAAVTCRSCSHVAFSDNTFTHLGGVGLSLGGGDHNSVSGNIVADVSGTGIQLGDADESAPLESHDAVTNNYVHDVANEYLAGIGILAAYVKNTTIAHNEVWNTPYTGISLGWGWGGHDAGMVDNHVDHNRVHDVMTAALIDGGPIYVNGIQGSSPASTIKGNYVAQTGQIGGAVYLDNGARYWQVSDNVVDDWNPAWLVLNPGYDYNATNGADIYPPAYFVPGADHNTVQDNFVAPKSATGGVFGQDESGPWGTPDSHHHADHDNVIDGTDHASSWPAAALTIIANAGLDADRAALLRGPAVTNLAYLSDAQAMTRTEDAARAVTGQVYGGSWATYAAPYASGSATPGQWWQTDLGASYDLEDIQVLFRQDSDVLGERKNFEIWVSNHEDMSLGHTVACRQGSSPLAFQARYRCLAPEGSWRYLAVVKTDGNELVLQQVRVFGSDANLAVGKEVYSTTPFSEATAASNAVDGDLGTIFATPIAGGWWEVDLGRQANLSLAQLVFRSDGWDDPAERKNLEVWVSNYADMSQGKTVACTLGEAPLAYAGTVSCSLPPGPWRYLAVKKTDSDGLAMAEVRIFGH